MNKVQLSMKPAAQGSVFTAPGNPESLLPIDVVCTRVGLGRSEVYDRVKRGNFPRQIKIGRRSVWVESEVNGWINEQIQRARTKSNPSACVQARPARC